MARFKSGKKTQQKRYKKYEDYNWIAMFNDGLFKEFERFRTTVYKYLPHYGMHSLKLRKAGSFRDILRAICL